MPKLIIFLNSFSQGKSGGDLVAIQIAKRLPFAKTIITSLGGSKLCQKEGLRADYILTSQEAAFGKILFTYFLRTIRALKINIPISKKGIILASSDFLPDVLPAFFLKIRHPKILWLQHIFHLIPRNRTIPFLGQRVSFLFITRFADAIVVDNLSVLNQLIKLGFRKEKVFPNYPGLDLEKFKNVKKSDFSYTATFVGQLRPQKGIFELVKIWELVCLKNPQAKLAIIGAGKQEILTKLASKIEQAKLKKNIVLLGYLPGKKVYEAIKSSRIFIFPSFEEGFGIALLEAQALGVPTVAWDLPVYQEVFGKSVFSVETGNTFAFAKAVLKLQVNPKLYQNYVIWGLKNTRKYSWDESAKRELAIINNCI